MTAPAATASAAPPPPLAPHAEAPALAARAVAGRLRTPPALGLMVCLLLALVQIAWAGYQLGVGNQAIQIAFLEHAHNPALFARDPMVTQTQASYPTWIFALLAPLLRISPLEPLYLALHVATTFALMAAAYALARAITRSHFTAVMTLLLLLAGHHRALAGDTLYSTAFTHTYAALPLALLALALFYRGQRVAAFALAGVLFNLHALTAAYALFMMTLGLLADLPDERLWPLVRRGMFCGLVALVCAAPTLAIMLAHRQSYDAQWLNLMRIRSADHSFPGTWWVSGDPDIPRFGLLLALFALSLSFSVSSRAARITRWITLAVLILFAAGYLFTEIWPTPLVVRAQLFRASRLLMIVMFIHLAHAGAQALRMLARQELVPLATRLMEALCGLLMLASLAIPALLPLLPVAVLATMIAALVTGRLAWWQATVATAALVLALAANARIDFPLFAPPPAQDWSHFAPSWPHALDPLILLPLPAALLLAIAARHLRHPAALLATLLGSLILLAAGTSTLFDRTLSPAPDQPDGLAAALAWTRQKTPADALFLAPSTLANFRIHAQRSLVADWRDGTQLYFSAAFGPTWFRNLSAIEPGIVLSPDGARLISRGQSLDTLDDESLINLAKRFGATDILLPTPPASKPRTLAALYRNDAWTVFAPRFNPVAAAAVPPGTINPAAWQAMEKFMATTVYPNIEKNRKADLVIQVLDPAGRPVQDLPASLVQTRHAFLFGSSLSFFKPNSVDSLGDQKAPPVTPQELALFPQLFNASMIPFASKWLYIEPTDGQHDFSELDAYVKYATQHDTTLEFHFLSGLAPAFLRKNPTLHAQRFPDHARELVARYHDQIKYWQVTNDDILLTVSPPIFKELHQKYPDIKLGLSNCTRFFYGPPINGRSAGQMQGYNGLLWLKKQGIQPDFFSIHGHYPAGCWTDPRDMYEVLDLYAKQGVKIHVSEMLLPLDSPIAGPVRRGQWTDALQAEFYERYLAVCFSHPAVEMVNLWGIARSGWGANSGLLDKDFKPRLPFTRLQSLFQKTWHTELQAQLPLDGTLRTRAFHGEYNFSLTLPGGRVVNKTLTVPETAATTLRFRLDAQTGTLETITSEK